MNDAEIFELINEYIEENHVSPFREDSEFINYVKEGIQDINSYVGKEINYKEDLVARSLLKRYVLYADYKKIEEFKQKNIAEYDCLQRKYSNEFLNNTNI